MDGWPVQNKNEVSFVSRKHKPGHGYETENLLCSVERCDGFVKYQMDAGKFQLDVMLQKILIRVSVTGSNHIKEINVFTQHLFTLDLE